MFAVVGSVADRRPALAVEDIKNVCPCAEQIWRRKGQRTMLKVKGEK